MSNKSVFSISDVAFSAAHAKENNSIENKNQIKQILPHREKALLVDRVIYLHYKQDDKDLLKPDIHAQLLAHNNHPSFEGHFYGMPIFRGVDIVEALAQSASIHFTLTSHEISSDKIPVFSGINAMRFVSPVRPGDVIDLFATLVNSTNRIVRYQVEARVRGRIVARGEIEAGTIPSSRLLDGT